MLQPRIYQAASLRLRSPPYGASSFFSIHGKFGNRTETVHSISNLAAAKYNSSKEALQLSTSRSSRPAAAPAAAMASTTAATDAKPAPGAGGPQLKLLVDRPSRRVLYAEARKDAVDFLIGLLRVPAGLAARALAKQGEPAPGSLGSLYAGALALDDAFFVSASPNRDALLSPAALPSAAPLLLGGDGAVPTAPAPPPPQRYYRCSAYTSPCRGNPMNVTDVAGLPCPDCRQPMSVEMRLAPGDAHGKLALAQAQEAAGLGAGGYVRELVTYLVMDDLTVAPMSTISAIMLLKKFDVKDCSALEEMTVELGTKEAVMLLKASLQSSTALTDVFSGGVSIDRIGG